ncbi:uncharacterized protein UV8b_07072 [Ustilaginoidea virens]|uniref:Uncharacterized protein n=1 Tax=Ustilaginoidea virens TaxID=1159556 RepID=A0A063C6G6_USTVR|nr:uncharacterized protein UV8b_07072 [Ustilaginoidea virens]QUC22831.1 hypothetical protein UV8b_07072 [Ustilaginoidea virens]GAO15368.1 hypothetical protein UVI_02010320 [Ustilaginoidea virens]
MVRNIDPLLCHKYAQFAAHLDRWHFKVIYWTMFISNLLVLFFGSWVYTSGLKAIDRLEANAHKKTKALRTYILLSTACVVVSTVIVVMEAYILLALQFCDGEDLMSLYWSTWTMTQVGSLIAIIGIVLALLHSLRNRKHPPWALALGTPVLVIAGILHLVHDCSKKRVKKLRRPSEAAGDDGKGPPMSQANTIQNSRDDDECSEIQAELIGFTIDGGPIVKFTHPVSEMTRGQLLGRDYNGFSTFSFPRGVVRFDAEAGK